MKKEMKDVTFDEFSEWANRRACDGQWSMLDAMISAEVISEVMKVKSIFHRKKKCIAFMGAKNLLRNAFYLNQI